MVKKIGNVIFIILFLLFNHIGAQEHIALQARTVNGDPLSEAVVGVPFLLEARVNSTDSIPGTPQITGLQQLQVEDKGHVSTINSIVNGIRSTKKIFQYRVRIDNPGMYTIGPALLVNKKKRLQSNIFTLEVLQEQRAQKKSEPFIKTVIDKNKVVIGEPIQFFLRFYPLSAAHLEGISEPKFTNFSAEKLDGPYTGNEVIEGDEYSYIEWKTTLYPQKAGALKIPSIAAAYKKQRNRRPTGFEMFDQLFRGGLDQKQIFSNALAIDVEELPAHDAPVSGIGTFDSLLATIDHNEAQEGEGMVYSLILEGKGDLASIEPIELTVPEGLKYYESKSKLDATGKKKLFEYIIQGMKPGSWQIPKQTFTYFDLATRTYKQLESNALEITIKDSDLKSVTAEFVDKKEDSQNKMNDEITKLDTDGPWQVRKERSIPGLLFILLLSIPAAIGIYRLVIRAREKYRNGHLVVLNKKNAFKYAYKDLQSARENHDVSALYDLIVQLFVRRASIPPAHISVEVIDEYLEQHEFSNEERREWQQFFNELLQYKFFEKRGALNDELFKKTEEWLSCLKKRL